LGLSIDRIVVVEGHSDAIGSGFGAVGSRSLQTAGVAIVAAATAVVERARRLVADRLEAAPNDIVLNHVRSAFHVRGTPSLAIAWTELAAMAATPETELHCGAMHDPEGGFTFPSGTHVAVVEVDAESGDVGLRRYVAVDDAGSRVNPMLVDGQLHGGIASGVSQVLGEEVVYDENGSLLTANFGDYTIVSSGQLPMLELFASETASTFNPHGFKAVGESGVLGAIPAMHNAVMDALAPLGVTHIDLPCTPMRVWRAIEEFRRPAT
jgi:carbon-monoxide dehydrogenase large subunit